MTKEIINEINSGTVHITEDVIVSIATVEISNIEGVYPLPVKMVERFSTKGLNKDVDVNIDESNVYLTIRIAIEYGKNLVEVAKTIQEKVKERIETMTGLEVIEVNVVVSNVVIPKESKDNIQ